MKVSKLLFVLSLVALGACSRQAVVPEAPPSGPIIVPPISDTTSPSIPNQGGSVHVVQPGETLYRIGKTYGYSYQQIATWNGIRPPYTLSVGQRLLVSPSGTPPVSTAPITTAPVSTIPIGSTMQHHKVSRGETLYSVARLYGRTFQELAAWNGIQPPYTLSVGQNLVIAGGSGNAYQPSQPSIVPPASYTSTGHHTVRAGETLYSIARQHGYDYQQLAQWNGISPPYTLSVGQQLRLVRTSSTQSAGSAPANDGFRSLSVSTPNNGWSVYTVRTGDTLYEVAQRYGRDYRELASWNRLSPPYRLLVGQTLYVGPPGTSNAPEIVAPPTYHAQSASAPTYTPLNVNKTYHTVQAGESLATIAARYGQTQHELALWNGIKPPYLLSPGQSLLVMK